MRPTRDEPLIPNRCTLRFCPLRNTEPGKSLFVQFHSQSRRLRHLQVSVLSANLLPRQELAKVRILLGYEFRNQRVGNGIQPMQGGGDVDVGCETVVRNGSPCCAAMGAIFMASVKPPHRVKSTCTTSIFPSSINRR